MKIQKPIIKNLSIVLVGRFNPPIITPAWLALKGLVRESEIENADVKIIHSEISHFILSFVELNVTSEKMILYCENEADFELVKDLAVSVLNYLKETPITAIGLNNTTHFAFSKEEEYINFGNWLAPHKIWKDKIDEPRLFELKILEPFKESSPVKTLVTITISEKIKPFGVSYSN
ncbi:hypothetical protein IU405_00180, partial [Polaribacter sp. BAL334]|uniref:hypothetical protein n=1 Tax=Polaribacter sp. BAL334 TaxID=1708178 RepID=UPI0018D22A62